jgi:hypothetical protein
MTTAMQLSYQPMPEQCRDICRLKFFLDFSVSHSRTISTNAQKLDSIATVPTQNWFYFYLYRHLCSLRFVVKMRGFGAKRQMNVSSVNAAVACARCIVFVFDNESSQSMQGSRPSPTVPVVAMHFPPRKSATSLSFYSMTSTTNNTIPHEQYRRSLLFVDTVSSTE